MRQQVGVRRWYPALDGAALLVVIGAAAWKKRRKNGGLVGENQAFSGRERQRVSIVVQGLSRSFDTLRKRVRMIDVAGRGKYHASLKTASQAPVRSLKVTGLSRRLRYQCVVVDGSCVLLSY